MRARPVVNVAVTIMGFVYVGVLGAFAGLLLSYQNGVGLILGVALCVVAYDVFGYFVGSQFGKPALAPMISPNKTVEGLVGGHGRRSIVVGARHRQPDHAVDDIGDALGARRHRRDRRAARRPLRVDAQARPRREGLRHVAAGPRRRSSTGSTRSCSACPAVYYLARALTIG